MVVEEIVWRGDDETKASPLGPGAALDRLLALPVAGDRTLPDGDTVVIRADLFAVPHACSDPWPSTVFRIYGDTRVGVLALFSDTATRIAFQESWKPGDGESCLRSGVKRPGSEAAVGVENAFVLAYGDELVTKTVEDVLKGVDPTTLKPLSLASGDGESAVETLEAFLAARSAGLPEHAFGARLIVPVDGAGDTSEADLGDPMRDAYQGWLKDAFHRQASSALDGTVSRVATSAATLLTDIVKLIEREGGTDPRLFAVEHPSATEAELTTESFVVFRRTSGIPSEWVIVRISR